MCAQPFFYCGSTCVSDWAVQPACICQWESAFSNRNHLQILYSAKLHYYTLQFKFVSFLEVLWNIVLTESKRNIEIYCRLVILFDSFSDVLELLSLQEYELNQPKVQKLWTHFFWSLLLGLVSLWVIYGRL